MRRISCVFGASFIDNLAIGQEFRKEVRGSARLIVPEAEIGHTALKNIQIQFPTIEAYREYIQRADDQRKKLCARRSPTILHNKRFSR
jgi:hypothetical protein